MFIKQYGTGTPLANSDISESSSPEFNLLSDETRIILGDIIQLNMVDTKNTLHSYIGTVIYNDSERIILLPQKDKNDILHLQFDDNNELQKIMNVTNNLELTNDDLEEIIITEKAAKLGYVALHDFNIGDDIIFNTEPDCQYHNLQATIEQLHNDSMVIKTHQEEPELLEIHFNYKGIPPETGIISIDKIIEDSDDDEIVYIEDEKELIIEDYVPIPEELQLYTNLDQTNDYIQKELVRLPKENKDELLNQLVKELDNWFELMNYQPTDNNIPLLNTYQNDIFSNNYLIPIVNDTKLIFLDRGDDQEDNPVGYHIKSRKKMLEQELEWGEIFNEKLLSTINYDRIIENQQLLWNSNTSYLPNNDCNRYYSNYANTSFLAVRDSFNCKTAFNLKNDELDNSTFDTRTIMGRFYRPMEEGKPQLLYRGEEYTLTGYMKLPYTYRTTVELADGIYTIKDISSHKKYQSLKEIHQKFRTINNIVDETAVDIEIGNMITFCITIDNNTIKFEGTLVREDEQYYYLTPIIPELLEVSEEWPFKKTELTSKDMITGMKQLTNECYSQHSSNIVVYPFENQLDTDGKNNFLSNMLLPIDSIIDYHSTLLSKAYSTLEIDKILYYYGIRFKDIQYPSRNRIDNYLTKNNNYLRKVYKYNKSQLAQSLIFANRDVVRHYTIENKIIKTMEDDYGNYHIFRKQLDNDNRRVNWLLSKEDRGMLYLYRYLITKDVDKTREEIDHLIHQNNILIQQYQAELAKYKSTFSKTPNQCDNFNITKVYNSLSLLEKDNQVDILFYDKHVDNTPKHLLIGVDVEAANIRNILKLKIQEADLDINNLDDTITNIINGGKIVKIGDKCIVNNNGSYQIWERTKPGESPFAIWVLSKLNTTIKNHIEYCLQQGMDLDKIEWNKLDKCVYNTVEKECLSEDDNRNILEIRNIEEYLEILEDSRKYYDSIEVNNVYRDRIILYFQQLLVYRNKINTRVINYRINEKSTDITQFQPDLMDGEQVYTAMEGFDKQGRAIITADVVDNSSLVNVTDIKHLKFDNTATIFYNEHKIYENLIKWISIIDIDVTKEHIIQLVKNIKAYLDKTKYSSRDIFFKVLIKQDSKFDAKKFKTDNNYNVRYSSIVTNKFMEYGNSNIIFAITAFVFILLQIEIPKIKLKTIYPLCKASLDGYPLDTDDTNIVGIEYISCILTYGFKNTDNPVWAVLNKFSIKKIITKVKDEIDHILNEFPLYIGRYTQARERNALRLLEKVNYPIMDSFLPILEISKLKTKIKGIESVSVDIDKLQKTELPHILLTKINSRNEYLGLQITNQLDNIISEESVVFPILSKPDIYTYLHEIKEELLDINIELFEMGEQMEQLDYTIVNKIVNIEPIENKDLLQLETAHLDDVPILPYMIYSLYKKYTTTGLPRLVNKMGRCINSGERIAAFHPSISDEESQRLFTQEMSHIKENDFKQLINAIKTNNIVEINNTISDVDFISILDNLLPHLTIQLFKDELMDKMEQFQKDIDIETKLSIVKSLCSNIDKETNTLIDTIIPFIGENNNSLDQLKLQQLENGLSNLGECNNIILNIDLQYNDNAMSNCLRLKHIEYNLKKFATFYNTTLHSIKNKKMLIEDTININKEWKLSEKHIGHLQQMILDNNSITNKYSQMIHSNPELYSIFDNMNSININHIMGVCDTINYQYQFASISIIDIHYINSIIKYLIMETIYNNLFDQPLELEDNQIKGQFLIDILDKFNYMMELQDITKTIIDENWDKMGEFDKQNIIKRIDKKDKEQRDVDRTLKSYKLGEWSKGLLSSVWKYDDIAYDKEVNIYEPPMVDGGIEEGPMGEGPLVEMGEGEKEEEIEYQIEDDLFDDDDDGVEIDDNMD